ncbi:hypothetical protein C8R46DRAFT_1135187 [Mycena filopes]|nr:hypothetical protein C8R46DRAFT_1135187 [Mycena filopes]
MPTMNVSNPWGTDSRSAASRCPRRSAPVLFLSQNDTWMRLSCVHFANDTVPERSCGMSKSRECKERVWRWGRECWVSRSTWDAVASFQAKFRTFRRANHSPAKNQGMTTSRVEGARSKQHAVRHSSLFGETLWAGRTIFTIRRSCSTGEETNSTNSAASMTPRSLSCTLRRWERRHRVHIAVRTTWGRRPQQNGGLKLG